MAHDVVVGDPVACVPPLVAWADDPLSCVPPELEEEEWPWVDLAFDTLDSSSKLHLSRMCGTTYKYSSDCSGIIYNKK